jgi:hypothetical protein
VHQCASQRHVILKPLRAPRDAETNWAQIGYPPARRMPSTRFHKYGDMFFGTRINDDRGWRKNDPFIRVLKNTLPYL